MPPEKVFKVWSTFDLSDLGPSTPVPLFFFDELVPLGKSLPPSFWQFIFTVWRDVLAPSGKKRDDGTYPHEHKCKKTLKQWTTDHRVSKPAAMDWNAACMFSGLFNVENGWRVPPYKESGMPTVMHYRKKATKEEWFVFIRGLNEAWEEQKELKMRRHTVHETDDGRKTTGRFGFQLMLANTIDYSRKRAGLTAVNGEHINKLIQLGAGDREKDGSVSFNFVGRVKRKWKDRGDGVYEQVEVK